MWMASRPSYAHGHDGLGNWRLEGRAGSVIPACIWRLIFLYLASCPLYHFLDDSLHARLVMLLLMFSLISSPSNRETSHQGLGRISPIHFEIIDCANSRYCRA